MSNKEREFQRWFVDDWKSGGRWAESIHPSYGMKTGIPDVLLLASSVLVPVELKLAELQGTQLKVSEIRPAQIRWAKKFSSHGGICGLVAGMKNDSGWRCFVVHNQAWWRGDCAFESDDFIEVNSSFSSVVHVLAQ